jgi:hypothetical protein
MRNISPPPPDAGQVESRTSFLNDGVKNKDFCDNTIGTGKYSMLSFLPLSLFEQCVICVVATH